MHTVPVGTVSKYETDSVRSALKQSVKQQFLEEFLKNLDEVPYESLGGNLGYSVDVVLCQGDKVDELMGVLMEAAANAEPGTGMPDTIQRAIEILRKIQ